AIRAVEATDTTLRFNVEVDHTSTPREVILQQLSPCEPLANLSAEEVGRGEPGSPTIEIPRFAGETDRMYARFTLKDSDAAESRHWVSEFSLGEQRHFPFPRPASIKGLQVQMVDDALALGIKHAGLNVSFPLLLSGSSDSPFWRDI